ncbi:MAG: hypothetical protein ACRD3S_13350 [Terracidiphilus sp.]
MPTASEHPDGRQGTIAGREKITNFEASGSGTGSAVSSANTSDAESTCASATATVFSETPGQAAQRSQTRSAGRESLATATAAITAQPGTSDAADTALRSPQVAHAAISTASHAQGIAAASSPASTQETFAALDRGTSLEAPIWTHAAGQHAEAGFHDPDLGWVGVRADLNASGIHATLVPSSADAAQTLSGHLAGLSSHLADEHAPVASLTMASPGESGADSGLGQRMQQGTEGNAQGNRPDEPAALPRNHLTAGSGTATSAITPESGVSFEVHAYTGEFRGTRISVIA